MPDQHYPEAQRSAEDFLNDPTKIEECPPSLAPCSESEALDTLFPKTPRERFNNSPYMQETYWRLNDILKAVEEQMTEPLPGILAAKAHIEWARVHLLRLARAEVERFEKDAETAMHVLGHRG